MGDRVLGKIFGGRRCETTQAAYTQEESPRFRGNRQCYTQQAYSSYQQSPYSNGGITIANYTQVEQIKPNENLSQSGQDQLRKLNASIEVLNKLEREHGCIRAVDSLNPGTPSRWETWKGRMNELNSGLANGQITPQQAEEKISWLIDRMQTTALKYIGEQTHRSQGDINNLVSQAEARQPRVTVQTSPKQAEYDTKPLTTVDQELAQKINEHRDLLIEAKRSVPHAGEQRKAWDSFITNRLKTLDEYSQKSVLTDEDRTKLHEIMSKDLTRRSERTGEYTVAEFVDWARKSKSGEMRVTQDPNNKGVYYVELPDKSFDCSWGVEVSDTHCRQTQISAGRTQNGRLFKVNVDTPGQEVTFKAVRYGYYRDRCGNCCQCIMDSKTIKFNPSETSEGQVTDTGRRLTEALGRKPKEVAPPPMPKVVAPEPPVEPTPKKPAPVEQEPKKTAPAKPVPSEMPKADPTPFEKPKTFDPKETREAIDLIVKSLQDKGKKLDTDFLSGVDKLSVDLDELIERKKKELGATEEIKTEATKTLPAVKKHADQVLEVLAEGAEGVGRLTALDIKTLEEVRTVVSQLQVVRADLVTLQQMMRKDAVAAEELLKSYDFITKPRKEPGALNPPTTTTTPENTAPEKTPKKDPDPALPEEPMKAAPKEDETLETVKKLVGDKLKPEQIEVLTKAPKTLRDFYLSTFELANEQYKTPFDSAVLISSNREGQNPPADGVLKNVVAYIKPDDGRLVLQFTTTDLKVSPPAPESQYYTYDLASMLNMGDPKEGENGLEYLLRVGKKSDESELPKSK